MAKPLRMTRDALALWPPTAHTCGSRATSTADTRLFHIQTRRCSKPLFGHGRQTVHELAPAPRRARPACPRGPTRRARRARRRRPPAPRSSVPRRCAPCRRPRAPPTTAPRPVHATGNFTTTPQTAAGMPRKRAHATQEVDCHTQPHRAPCACLQRQTGPLGAIFSKH